MKGILLCYLMWVCQIGFAQIPNPKFEVWNNQELVDYEVGISLPTQDLVLGAKDEEGYKFKVEDYRVNIISKEGLAIKSYRVSGESNLVRFTKICRPGRIILIKIISYKVKTPEGKVELICYKNPRVRKFSII
ncbi:MAG: hypothetical protein OCD76_05210 [Reichenbachiella sp.]